MNNIKKLLCTLVAITFMATPAFSDAGNAGGFYVGVSGSAAGAELDGQYTDNEGNITKGTGGAVGSVGAFDLGYNWAMGSSLFLGFGASYTPGDLDIGKADDSADAADVTITADKFITYYIKPAIMVSDNTAFFAKFGNATADLQIAGDVAGTKSNELKGDTVSFGSATYFDGGMYVESEVGITDYDQIHANDVGNADTGGNGVTGDSIADPSIAFGTITIGFKF